MKNYKIGQPLHQKPVAPSDFHRKSRRAKVACQTHRQWDIYATPLIAFSRSTRQDVIPIAWTCNYVPALDICSILRSRQMWSFKDETWCIKRIHRCNKMSEILLRFSGVHGYHTRKHCKCRKCIQIRTCRK